MLKERVRAHTASKTNTPNFIEPFLAHCVMLRLEVDLLSCPKGFAISFYFQFLVLIPESSSSFFSCLKSPVSLLLRQISPLQFSVSWNLAFNDISQQSIPSHSLSHLVSFLPYKCLWYVSLLVNCAQDLLISFKYYFSPTPCFKTLKVFLFLLPGNPRPCSIQPYTPYLS